MQPNHALALLGLVLIATSVTGLVLVEEKLPGEGINWHLNTYLLSFPTAVGSQSESGSTTDGGSDVATLRIQSVNLTGATLTVSWNDNRPIFSRNSASIGVDITGPQSQSGSGEGTSGTVTIELDGFNSRPNETEIEAETPEEAVSGAYELNPTATNGTGDWTVTITVSRAGLIGPFRRGSVDWTATIEYANYSLEILSPAEEDPQTSEALTSGVSS